MKKIIEEMDRCKIINLSNSIFIKKFVELPNDVQIDIERVGILKEDAINDLYRTILKAQVAIACGIEDNLNGLLNISNGELTIVLSKDVTLHGYVNATEEAVEMRLKAGTLLNWLEFIVHPLYGLVFQLCLGDGPTGHHFNVPASVALDASEDLMTFIKDAARLTQEDDELNAAVYGEMIGKTAEAEDGNWS